MYVSVYVYVCPHRTNGLNVRVHVYVYVIVNVGVYVVGVYSYVGVQAGVHVCTHGVAQYVWGGCTEVTHTARVMMRARVRSQDG